MISRYERPEVRRYDRQGRRTLREDGGELVTIEEVQSRVDSEGNSVGVLLWLTLYDVNKKT